MTYSRPEVVPGSPPNCHPGVPTPLDRTPSAISANPECVGAIYAGKGRYNDIGSILAKKIRSLASELGSPVVEPINKIRATVIGAGAYSLSVSGSSGFMDDKLKLPIRNIPVLRVDVEYAKLSLEHVVSRVNMAFQRNDLVEGQEIAALYFKDPVRVNYPALELFAKSMEAALPNAIAKKMPIILIFQKDIACSVGNVIRRATACTPICSLSMNCP